MGIPGLTTFIDANSQILLHDIKLRNTNLIIDANNLCHFLYYRYNCSVRTGGDYTLYEDAIVTFIKALHRCKIKPIFVFDGAYDINDKKFPLQVKRLKHRRNRANSSASGNRGNVLPVLAMQVLEDTLISFIRESDGILDKDAVKVCSYESDGEIAALAMKMGAPVLSNDSDFYIFNLKGGFILIDYLDLQIKESESDGCYFSGQIFHQHILSSLVGINDEISEKMALFASLQGNDRIFKSEFDEFYIKTSFPRMHVEADKTKRLKSTSLEKRDFLGVLLWLGKSNRSYKQTLSYIISCFASTSKVKDVLTESVHSYISPSMTSRSMNMPNYTDPKDRQGNTINESFMIAYSNTSMPCTLINVFISRVMLLKVQVELMSSVSSYDASASLRKVIYNILLRENCIVEEYDRKGNDSVIRKIKVQENSDDKEYPCLDRIVAMETHERIEYLYSCLECNPLKLEHFDLDLQFLFTIMTIWIRNAKPEVNGSIVMAVIISYIKLSIVNKNVNDDKTECGCCSKYQRCRYCISDSKLICRKLQSFETKQTKELQYPEYLHCFSELQTIALYTHYIIRLLSLQKDGSLADGLPRFHCSRMFSGPLIYSVACFLHKADLWSSEGFDKVSDVFGGNQDLTTYSMTLYNLLFELDDNLKKKLWKDIKINKPLSAKRIRHNEKKKNRKLQSMKLEKVVISEDDDDNDDNDDDNDDQNQLLNIDNVINRFNLLTC